MDISILRERLLEELQNVQIQSENLQSVWLTEQQFRLIEEYMADILSAASAEELQFLLSNAGATCDVEWQLYQINMLFDLIENIVESKGDCTFEDLAVYIDVTMDGAQSPNMDASDKLEHVIPATVSDIRGEFRRFVDESHVKLNTSDNEPLKQWFSELLKFGDRFEHCVS